MTDFVMPLMLPLDVASLTMSLVNMASPRGDVGALADSVEAALRALPHLNVERAGDTVIARTDSGLHSRVIVAARLDTAPITEEPLARVEMGKLYGPGAAGAKGALGVALKAAALGDYNCDVTFLFAADGDVPLPEADFVLLARPTNAAVVATGPDHPLTKRLLALTDHEAADAATLSATGSATVAFGPGDPSLAGTPDEFVPTAELTQCEFVLRQWLTA